LLTWRAVDCALPDADEEAFQNSGRLVKRNMFPQAKVIIGEDAEKKKDELVCARSR
jgi:hypothetical protein